MTNSSQVKNNVGQTLRLHIDQAAIVENYKILKDASMSQKCGAAVKANGYGCGVKTVARALANAGCRQFFVADASEGVKLRTIQSDADIFILNGVFEETISLLVENNLIPVLNSLHQIKLWYQTATDQACAVHIDTGMNRLGLRPNEAYNCLDDLKSVPKLIMSHFANADDPEDPKNLSQLEAFSALAQKYAGIEASMANSAATLSNPQSHFQLTRPGIAIYGGNPFTHRTNPMKSVVKAEARIIDIREVLPDETVSYGGTFVAKETKRIAVCGVGYADGYPRTVSGQGVPLREHLPNGAQAHINGELIDCVGRITMDLTMFDVTQLPLNSIKIGDWIELFGDQISLDHFAEQSGTVSYEILTGIGRRYGLSI
ncbi:MAG: alanine racemase [Lentilitoribacter sp.]